MKKLVLAFLFASSSALAAKVCKSNNEILSAGWVQHSPSEFNKMQNRFADEVTSNESLVKDFGTVFYSTHLKTFVHLQSWDDVKTPEDEMFGDIVIYSDPKTQNVFEIRWYEGGKKHFVISTDQCSCDNAPLSENTLF